MILEICLISTSWATANMVQRGTKEREGAYPSNEELVQSYTISLLPFICRYASQLSHPSYSNWSIVCKEKKNGG